MLDFYMFAGTVDCGKSLIRDLRNVRSSAIGKIDEILTASMRKGK